LIVLSSLQTANHKIQGKPLVPDFKNKAFEIL